MKVIYYKFTEQFKKQSSSLKFSLLTILKLLECPNSDTPLELKCSRVGTGTCRTWICFHGLNPSWSLHAYTLGINYCTVNFNHACWRCFVFIHNSIVYNTSLEWKISSYIKRGEINTLKENTQKLFNITQSISKYYSTITT